MSNKTMKTIQAALRVSRKDYLTDHYIRVYLTGDAVYKFANTTVGVNNKVLIPPVGATEVHFPEFDYETMQWKPQPEEIRSIVRTYTHRGIDLATNEIWIDFVAHGDEGPASAWAIRAQVGDPLGVLMKDGKLPLYAEADHYLLVGDATAIPVLGAILEDLPATAKGTCIIEVSGALDEQKLQTKAAIDFIWLYNLHPQDGSTLADQVCRLVLPEGNRFAYVAAEFASVKAIRAYLRKEKGWSREELYAYSYWKSGVAEDKSVADRHAENEKS